jgi:hypothetical protein
MIARFLFCAVVLLSPALGAADVAMSDLFKGSNIIGATGAPVATLCDVVATIKEVDPGLIGHPELPSPTITAIEIEAVNGKALPKPVLLPVGFSLVKAKELPKPGRYNAKGWEWMTINGIPGGVEKVRPELFRKNGPIKVVTMFTVLEIEPIK